MSRVDAYDVILTSSAQFVLVLRSTMVLTEERTFHGDASEGHGGQREAGTWGRERDSDCGEYVLRHGSTKALRVSQPVSVICHDPDFKCHLSVCVGV